MAEFKNLKKGESFPLKIELAAGKYKWCSCGYTKRVPWCDGTCEGDKPVKFKLKKAAKVEICNCGRTKTPPYCDGSHKKLKSG